LNGLIIGAGTLATIILIGHCTVGRRDYFLPMKEADFDPYARRVMEFVWHMSTVSIALMCAALLGAGFGLTPAGSELLVLFATAHFVVWGLVHLSLGLSSGLPRAPMRMFQWVLFLCVAVTAWFGLTMG
jgi:hypothetical protein